MAREVPQYISQLSMGSMPKIQYSNAQAQATQRVSEQLFSLSEGIREKDMQIEKIRATTQLQTELNRQYKEFGNDPGKLKAAQDSFKEGFIKGIKDPDLADQFAAWYDSVAMPYLNKATEIYADNQDAALKLSIMEGTNAEIASAEAVADGMVSNVPEHAEDAGKALIKGMTRIEQYKTAKKHDGSMLFSPSEIMAEEKRIQAAYEKKANALRLAPIEKELMNNPTGLIEKINSGEFDGKFKDAKEKEKYLKEGIAKFKDNEERGQVLRVVDAAVKDKEIYSEFVNNAPDILEKIENYKANGGNEELADYMRKQALKANPISASEQDQIYTSIIDEVNQLQITTKQGKVKIGKDDATLEDVTRLQQKIMKASVQGVTGLDSQLKKLSPAILEMAKKERGKDDLGVDSFFGFFRNTEAYDPGYETIQKYLEGQGKEKDYAAKSSMMREFINRADQIPEDIQKDDQLFQQAQEKIAQAVIAGQAQKGMKNIPTTAIQYLIANPTTSKQFDELFGVGSAARVLGK